MSFKFWYDEMHMAVYLLEAVAAADVMEVEMLIA
jgi:hypothetical protein